MARLSIEGDDVEKELYRRFFEVEDRHWWFVGRRQIVLDLLDRSLAKQSNGSREAPLLDFGCGTGGLLPYLTALRPAVGIDSSPDAAKFWGERRAPIALASGAQLPFADGTFAGAVLLDVIEHVDDDVELLRELFRVLKPGGVAVITVPALPWLWSKHDDINHHRRRYRRAELSRAIEGAGLRCLRASYYNMLLLPLAAGRKFLQRINNSGDHVDVPAHPANLLLRTVMSVERPFIRWRDLPLGASLIAVAERPVQAPVVSGGADGAGDLSAHQGAEADSPRPDIGSSSRRR